MASAIKVSWMVAASISTVETLKDQGGLCRWNYAIRSLHHKARKQMVSLSQLSSSSTLMGGVRRVGSKGEKFNRAEESFRKVMYLSCWNQN